MFKADEYEKLRAGLVVDMNNLDKELEQLPMQMQEVTEGTAAAFWHRENMKLRLDVRSAEKAQSFKRAFSTDAGRPISDKQVEQMLVADGELIEMAELLEHTKEDANRWGGLVEAYKAKGRALQRLSELLLAGWTAPNHAKTPGSYAADKEAMNAQRKRFDFRKRNSE